MNGVAFVLVGLTLLSMGMDQTWICRFTAGFLVGYGMLEMIIGALGFFQKRK